VPALIFLCITVLDTGHRDLWLILLCSVWLVLYHYCVHYVHKCLIDCWDITSIALYVSTNVAEFHHLFYSLCIILCMNWLVKRLWSYDLMALYKFIMIIIIIMHLHLESKGRPHTHAISLSNIDQVKITLSLANLALNLKKVILKHLATYQMHCYISCLKSWLRDWCISD